MEFSKVTMKKKVPLENIEECIKETWKKGVKKDYQVALWWNESEIVASFYHHFRKK